MYDQVQHGMKLADWILLLSLAASWGCTDAAAPTPPLALQADSPAYTLQPIPSGYQATIGLVLTNRTASPVFIGNCNANFPAHLEKFVAGDWIPAWSGFWNLCASPPIVVTPGSEHRAALKVFAGSPSNNVFPKWLTVDIPGEYRVVAESLHDGTRPLPIDQRVSNTFTISTGPP